MPLFFGHHDSPIIMLHGGAGPMDPTHSGILKATEILTTISASTVTEDGNLQVTKALQAMEDEPTFNAGIGSALQQDGVCRVSAALMNGDRQTFSGVMSTTNVRYPSQIALHLQNHDSRVLADPGASLMARTLNLPVEDLVTAKRLQRWLERRDGCDTVGAVLRNSEGLVAGTSTGGRGNEFPGRISDSATVAGNYASSFAAVSATGIGEEIVDDAVATRIECRVRDGMTLKEACEKTYQEAEGRSRSYGWIAIDSQGNWCAAHTTPAMSWVVREIGGRLLQSS